MSDGTLVNFSWADAAGDVESQTTLWENGLPLPRIGERVDLPDDITLDVTSVTFVVTRGRRNDRGIVQRSADPMDTVVSIIYIEGVHP